MPNLWLIIRSAIYTLSIVRFALWVQVSWYFACGIIATVTLNTIIWFWRKNNATTDHHTHAHTRTKNFAIQLWKYRKSLCSKLYFLSYNCFNRSFYCFLIFFPSSSFSFVSFNFTQLRLFHVQLYKTMMLMHCWRLDSDTKVTVAQNSPKIVQRCFSFAIYWVFFLFLPLLFWVVSGYFFLHSIDNPKRNMCIKRLKIPIPHSPAHQILNTKNAKFPSYFRHSTMNIKIERKKRERKTTEEVWDERQQTEKFQKGKTQVVFKFSNHFPRCVVPHCG